MATKAARRTIERQVKARLFAKLKRFDDFCALIGFEPHDAQREVIDSDAWIKVIRWGTRAGKTRLVATIAAFVLLQKNTKVWVTAPDHGLCGRVWDELTRILLDDLGLDATRSSARAPYYLEFEWGARCEGKSTEHGARKSLVGEELDLLIWDEAARSPGSVWPDLSNRLGGAGHRGKALIISTPYGLNHFQDLYQFAETDQDWAAFHDPSWANPHLDPVWIESQRRELTPEAFSQNLEAEFTSFAGMVYKEWQRDLHVPAEPIEYDEALPLYISFDFGTTNPFVCLWVQVTANDHLRIIDEYAATDRTIIDNGNAVLDHHAAMGYKDIDWFSADPSGRDEILTLQKHIGLRAHYRQMSRQNKEVAWGIDTIRRLLRVPTNEDGTHGTPRLLVSPVCTETIREFGTYRYPEARDEQNAREEPVKADDHCMDALRYFVACWYARGAGYREARRLRGDDDSRRRVRPALERILDRNAALVGGA